MDRVKEMLDNNIPLRSGTWNIEEVSKINELIPQAITLKPIVYLVNLDAKSFKRKGNKWLVPINDWVNTHGGGIIIPMSVEWEQGELLMLLISFFHVSNIHCQIQIIYYLVIN